MPKRETVWKKRLVYAPRYLSGGKGREKGRRPLEGDKIGVIPENLNPPSLYIPDPDLYRDDEYPAISPKLFWVSVAGIWVFCIFLATVVYIYA